MDFFGRKAKAKAKELDEANTRLVRALREMDQLVFQMTQCTSWDMMRPVFLRLQEPVNERMRIESKRVEQLLIPEIKKVYSE